MQLLCCAVEVRIFSAFYGEASTLHLQPCTLAVHFHAIGNRHHLLEIAVAGLGGVEMEAELTQARRMKPGWCKDETSGNQALGIFLQLASLP